jgi:hypothetical protein
MRVGVARSADPQPTDSVSSSLLCWRRHQAVFAPSAAPSWGNGDVEAIAESIRAHGQYRAMVVNKRTMQVLAGNHLLQALYEVEATHALAHFVDVDEDEALRINLADNRIPELGGYDHQQLANLLGSLDGDFEGTGYDQEALDKVLTRIASDESQQLDPPVERSLECPSCGHVAPAKKFGAPED